MIFLTVEEVIEIHSDFIRKQGGLNGIRDLSLLISAVETPKSMMFGEFLHESIYDKAAAYLFHIVCNHPFIDGNKRTGSAAALIFLEENEVAIEIDEIDYEILVCEVAKGLTTKFQISDFFKSCKR